MHGRASSSRPASAHSDSGRARHSERSEESSSDTRLSPKRQRHHAALARAVAPAISAAGTLPHDRHHHTVRAPTTITVHLVRHGETGDNAVRRFQVPEVPLSDKGREQATAVAETLAASVKATMILASDYARAWETAGIIASRLDLPVTAEEALRERNFGVWRGQMYADLGDAVIEAYRQPRMRIDGGESWADVFERVEAPRPPARRTARERDDPRHARRHYERDPAAPRRLHIDDFTLAPLENCAVRTLNSTADPDSSPILY